MFKNCVFKPDVNTIKWCKATGTVISSVDWKMVVSASIVAGVVSVLTSIAGIPEVGANDENI